MSWKPHFLGSILGAAAGGTTGALTSGEDVSPGELRKRILVGSGAGLGVGALGTFLFRKRLEDILSKSDEARRRFASSSSAVESMDTMLPKQKEIIDDLGVQVNNLEEDHIKFMDLGKQLESAGKHNEAHKAFQSAEQIKPSLEELKQKLHHESRGYRILEEQRGTMQRRGEVALSDIQRSGATLGLTSLFTSAVPGGLAGYGTSLFGVKHKGFAEKPVKDKTASTVSRNVSEFLRAIEKDPQLEKKAATMMDLGKGALIGTGATLGSILAGTAADKIRDLYLDSRKASYYKTMLDENPSLSREEVSPREVQKHFNTLFKFNPAYASDPVVAGTYIKNCLEFARPNLDSLNNIVGARKNFEEARLKSRESPRNRGAEEIMRAVPTFAGMLGAV